jgi:hypothetical protein
LLIFIEASTRYYTIQKTSEEKKHLESLIAMLKRHKQKRESKRQALLRPSSPTPESPENMKSRPALPRIPPRVCLAGERKQKTSRSITVGSVNIVEISIPNEVY